MNKELLRNFRNPPAIYRGKPFWAWNGRLDPEELRWQVRVMQRMGLGGFFMHSRIGLETEYLSEEWHACIDACIDEARKLGMEAWLYDEDRWPSGSGGGIVTADKRYRMKYLEMRKSTNGKLRNPPGTRLARFIAKVDGCTATNVRRLRSGERPRLHQGETFLDFYVREAPKSSWYNGETYLDTMDHASVKAFINSTHQEYRRRFGKDFGGTIPGMFTDEPNHGGYFNEMQWTSRGKSVPWTTKLPSVFQSRYRYDVLDHLPELFLDVDGDGVTPARHNFHDCTTFLFADAFGRQIGEWCDRNEMIHTGHILAEQTLSSQTWVVGSCMRFYEHMQAPGMDLLTQYWREYDTAKQVSSAARQFGKTWRLTETYGCTGWDFPFEGHKAIGDWQVAMGINLRCQHLSWYTMRGTAKRDYPASIFYQSPWWDSYHVVEDYFGRVHAAMTRGEEVRDLLVVHPVESMWVQCRQDWWGDEYLPKKHVIDFDNTLSLVRDALLGANIDFDYGDEEILSRHGKLSLRGKEPSIVLGKARYKAVLVPPLITMRTSTLKLLKRFQKAGGTVVFAGPACKYLDAMPSEKVKTFAACCVSAPVKGEQLAKSVDPLCRRISITDEDGSEIVPALYLLREDSEAMYLFVCNVGHDFRGKPLDPHIRNRLSVFPKASIHGFVGCKGKPLELDPNTGEVTTTSARRRRDGWAIETSLGHSGSRIFVIPKRAGKSAVRVAKPLRIARSRTLSAKRWDISLSENNNFVLDRPAFRIGSGRWRKADEILRVDLAVRKEASIPERHWSMVQPWAIKRRKNPPSVAIALRYRFQVDSSPSGDVCLALENPEQFDAALNGHQLNTDTECGWWTDKSLRKIGFPPTLFRIGENELVLRCKYDENHPGLEPVFLLGNFGAKLKGTGAVMTNPPASLRLGNWVGQSLAFYSGSVTYLKKVRPDLKGKERLFVRASDFDGVAIRVWVDGNIAGITGWEPFEVEITDYCKLETILLGIEVLGHRRNSHGPLHHTRRDVEFCGPDQFESTGQEWSDAYQLVPAGLKASPVLVWKK